MRWARGGDLLSYPAAGARLARAFALALDGGQQLFGVEASALHSRAI